LGAKFAALASLRSRSKRNWTASTKVSQAILAPNPSESSLGLKAAIHRIWDGWMRLRRDLKSKIQMIQPVTRDMEIVRDENHPKKREDDATNQTHTSRRLL
jgi:hypothetical protein